MKRKKFRSLKCLSVLFTIACICLVAAAVVVVLLRDCWQLGLCKMDSAAGLLPGIQETLGCKPDSSASTLCSVCVKWKCQKLLCQALSKFLPLNCMLDCTQPRLANSGSSDLSANSSSAGFAACTEDLRNATGSSGCSWDSMESTWSSANTKANWDCNVESNSSGSRDCTMESSACSLDSMGCSSACGAKKLKNVVNFEISRSRQRNLPLASEPCNSDLMENSLDLSASKQVTEGKK